MATGERLGIGGVVAMIVVLLAGFATAFTVHQRRLRDGREAVIAASSYRWTATCPSARYHIGDAVPRGCERKEYRLRSLWKLGLAASKRHQFWYRLGDAAVSLDCPLLARTAPCRATAVVAGRFRRAPPAFPPPAGPAPRGSSSPPRS